MSIGLIIVGVLAALAVIGLVYKMIKAAVFLGVVAAVAYYAYPHIDTIAGPLF